MAVPSDIMLGYGVFYYGAALTTSSLTAIGAVRGGGVFHREPTYRKLALDGDYGYVKGRVEIDEEIDTLTMRAVEFLPASINSFYPAMTSSAGGSVTTLTGNMDIADGDYKKVQFIGKTKGGNAITITVDNALNLGPLNWEFLDKNEVVDELVFTATSLEASTTTPSWKVEFATT